MAPDHRLPSVSRRHQKRGRIFGRRMSDSTGYDRSCMLSHFSCFLLSLFFCFSSKCHRVVSRRRSDAFPFHVAIPIAKLSVFNFFSRDVIYPLSRLGIAKPVHRDTPHRTRDLLLGVVLYLFSFCFSFIFLTVIYAEFRSFHLRNRCDSLWHFCFAKRRSFFPVAFSLNPRHSMSPIFNF